MWFNERNMYFCKIENYAYGEISERRFSTPTPGHKGPSRSARPPAPVSASVRSLH